MGLEGTYSNLYDNIKKAHPEWTRRQLIKEMEKYVGGGIQPIYTKDQLIAIVNHMLYEQGKPLIGTEKVVKWKFQDAAGKCKNGKYLPGYRSAFDEDERKKRLARSEAVRKVEIEFYDWEFTRKKIAKDAGRDGVTLPRHFQLMLLEPKSTEDLEERKRIMEYNAELLDLFGDSKEAYKKRRDALRNEHQVSEKEAEQMLRARRTEMLMDYIHRTMYGMEDLSKLLAPGLSRRQIEENTRRIINFHYLVTESKSILEESPQLFSLPAEGEKILLELEQRQNELAIALKKLCATAVPLYEYLDPDQIAVLDLDDVMYVNEDGFEFPLDPWNKEGKTSRKDPFKNVPKEYQNRVDDPVYTFFSDLSTLNMSAADVNLVKILKSYGFDPYDTHYVENERGTQNEQHFMLQHASKSVNPSNKLFSIERNGRTGVFQMQKDDTLKAVLPEVLFNDKLQRKHDVLKNMMKEADPAFYKNSEKFREMQRAFEASSRNGLLLRENEDLTQKQQLFENLRDISHSYIIGKLDTVAEIDSKRKEAKENKGKYELNKREKWDEWSTNMAVELRAFAETKLKELELIEKTRATMANYVKDDHQVMSDEERLAKIAKMDADWLQKEREKRPDQWVKDRVDEICSGKSPEKFNLPTSITDPLTKLANTINSRTLDQMIAEDQNAFKIMVGRMVATEQISQEDAFRLYQPGGKLRAFYTDEKTATDENFRELGAYALSHSLKKEPDQLTAEDLKRLSVTFDPRKLAEDTMDHAYGKINEDTLQMRLQGQYLNPIHPQRGVSLDSYEKALKTFTEANITSFNFNQLAKENKTQGRIKTEDARNLLANCAINSMIRCERDSQSLTVEPCALEGMLVHDKDGVINLQAELADPNGPLKRIYQKLIERDGGIDLHTLTTIINENLVQDFAAKNWKTYADRRKKQLFVNLFNALLEHGLENPEYRTVDGNRLDPTNQEDLSYLVSGRPVFAREEHQKEDKKEVKEVIFRGGVTPYAVDTGIVSALKDAISEAGLSEDPDAISIWMPFGNPLNPTWENELDLNTPDALDYLKNDDPTDIAPVTIYDGTKQLEFLYDPKTAKFTCQDKGYTEIRNLLKQAGFNPREATFLKPDGSPINMEMLYDTESADYQYLMSGHPFLVTAKDGRQILAEKSLLNKDNSFKFKQTAHDRLADFYEGKSRSEESEEKETISLQTVQKLENDCKNKEILFSGQYQDMLSSLDDLLKERPQNLRKQLHLDPERRKKFTELAKKMAVQAEAFLKDDGKKKGQEGRRNVAMMAKKAGEELAHLLSAEAAEERASRLWKEGTIATENRISFEPQKEQKEIPAVPDANQKEKQEENPKQKKLPFDTRLKHRKEIVEWLQQYQKHPDHGNQLGVEQMIAELMQMQNDGIKNISTTDWIANLQNHGFDEKKYSEQDLADAGIDPKVLTDSNARDSFLKQETSRKEETQFVMTTADGTAFDKLKPDEVKNRGIMLPAHTQGVYKDFMNGVQHLCPISASDMQKMLDKSGIPQELKENLKNLTQKYDETLKGMNALNKKNIETLITSASALSEQTKQALEQTGDQADKGTKQALESLKEFSEFHLETLKRYREALYPEKHDPRKNDPEKPQRAKSFADPVTKTNFMEINAEEKGIKEGKTRSNSYSEKPMDQKKERNPEEIHKQPVLKK